MTSTSHVAYSASEHPAPHRDRVGLVALFYGLFAAPIMWAGNFMIDYGLVSYACYPGSTPIPGQQGLTYLFWLTLAFYFLTLCVCASGFAVSYRNWRITGPVDKVDHWHHMVVKGEGRTRYLAIIGMSFSMLFFIATAFGIFIYIFEPLCAFE